MSQQTLSTTTRRPQGRNVRLLVGSVLSAGLLLVAAACGGDKGGDSNGTGSNDNTGGDAKAAVSALKVCELVDLKPLTTLTKSTFADGPTDVAPGGGRDPEGPQCAAQLKMPVLHTGPSKAVVSLSPGTVAVSVVAYNDATAASAKFDERVTTAKGDGDGGNTATDLSGAWTRGSLVAGAGAHKSYVYALVLQGSYVVKIEVTTPNDADYDEKYPFTIEDLKKTVTDTVTGLYTTVNGKVGGSK